MIGNALALVVASLVAFLPEPWREKHARTLPLTGGTAVGGTVQGFGFGILWFLGLIASVTGNTEMLFFRVYDATRSTTAPGAVGWFLYLLSPWSFFTGYFALEGFVRVASFWADQPCGTLPLWLLERGVSWVKSRRGKRRGPPPPDDVIARPEGGWRIACADERGRWHDLMTIEIDGAFFHVAEKQVDHGSLRPFVYLLAPVPASWTMRGLDRYR